MKYRAVSLTFLQTATCQCHVRHVSRACKWVNLEGLMTLTNKSYEKISYLYSEFG